MCGYKGQLGPDTHTPLVSEAKTHTNRRSEIFPIPLSLCDPLLALASKKSTLPFSGRFGPSTLGSSVVLAEDERCMLR